MLGGWAAYLGRPSSGQQSTQERGQGMEVLMTRLWAASQDIEAEVRSARAARSGSFFPHRLTHPPRTQEEYSYVCRVLAKICQIPLCALKHE